MLPALEVLTLESFRIFLLLLLDEEVFYEPLAFDNKNVAVCVADDVSGDAA
jgi:hypothetical protein